MVRADGTGYTRSSGSGRASWPARTARWSRALAPPVRRVGVAHLAALVATGVVLAAQGRDGLLAEDELLLGLFLCGAFSALRVAAVGRRLAVSTLALDATGTAVFLMGTDAPSSAYFFLAVAGAWWAAHLPGARSGAIWAGVFVLAYALLIVPGAIADRLLVHAIEDASVVVIVALLADWFVRVDGRALDLSEALARAPAGAEQLAIREGLSRALGPIEIPIDVLPAAGRAGLTVIQAELLAYLELGLTNQEIADATTVSEATVRYRLTRLYRALGVQGRKAAVRRATELGVSAGDRDEGIPGYR